MPVSLQTTMKMTTTRTYKTLSDLAFVVTNTWLGRGAWTWFGGGDNRGFLHRSFF